MRRRCPNSRRRRCLLGGADLRARATSARLRRCGLAGRRSSARTSQARRPSRPFGGVELYKTPEGGAFLYVGRELQEPCSSDSLIGDGCYFGEVALLLSSATGSARKLLRDVRRAAPPPSSPTTHLRSLDLADARDLPGGRSRRASRGASGRERADFLMMGFSPADGSHSAASLGRGELLARTRTYETRQTALRKRRSRRGSDAPPAQGFQRSPVREEHSGGWRRGKKCAAPRVKRRNTSRRRYRRSSAAVGTREERHQPSTAATAALALATAAGGAQRRPRAARPSSGGHAPGY